MTYLRNPAITEGVGTSVPRVEDDRYLRGRGLYVADQRPAGTQDLAFVRSPLAHARVLGIRKPPGAENRVFTAADLAGVLPIVANSALPGFKPSVQHALATDRVRYVGEAVAVCVAPTRAEAEDLAERLVSTLEAGQAAGGDKRGKQSAALKIHGQEAYPWLDLRVDEHTAPVAELRRVFGVAWHQLRPFIDAMPTRAGSGASMPASVTDMLALSPQDRPGGS